LDVKAELIDWIELFSWRKASASAWILNVDGDELTSYVYAGQLRSDGTFVQIENDPAAILTAIGQKEFDLVILHLQMPGINGIELAKVIRQSRKYF
jgi:CheY-like chemotaxis protein